MPFGGLGRSFGRLGAFAPGLPSWLPRASGIPATVFADFANNHYWATKNYGSASTWIAGLGGTYTRASIGTYVNSAGLVATAAVDTLRSDYNPSTLVATGILLEGPRTNVVLWSRDLTNAAWTASNVTVAKNQVGADGVTNSASSLTATAGNGTVLQAITLGSSARFQSAYVKRLAGSGVVNMTMDNGSTWTAITVTGAWTRVSIPTQTLANPTVGFRIVTNGDAIAVDYVQNENGNFVSSPIEVTTVAVARALDALSFPVPLATLQNIGTLFAITNNVGLVSGTADVFGLTNTTLTEGTSIRVSLSTNAKGILHRGNVVVVNMDRAIADATARVKHALGYTSGDTAFYANGNKAGYSGGAENTTYGDAVATGVYVGQQANVTTNNLYGDIEQMAIFPNRANDAELARLTT